ARPEGTAPVAADPKLKAIESGELPTAKPIKLATLQQKLVEPFSGPAKVTGGLRQLFGKDEAGLVVAGKALENKVERVTFDAGPVPVLSATVRYYTPGK